MKQLIKKIGAITYHAALGGTILLLAACDTKDATPLPGERVSFLNFTASIKADPSIANMSVT
ncbi:MAG: hypothetical protein NWQ29_04130, partial [Alphaproteobacteria bacterium]|nr:hypothetical protein [Alphaproteobacteria bacterium]